MSTRCNILITGGTFKLWIYRHWDGYPSMTGYQLGQMLKRLRFPNYCEPNAAQRATGFANMLVTTMREPSEHRGPEQEYEITATMHGDIEFFYHIHFCAEPTVRVTVHKRPGYDSSIDPNDWPKLVDRGTVADLRRVAAQDKREILKRYFRRQRQRNAA